MGVFMRMPKISLRLKTREKIFFCNILLLVFGRLHHYLESTKRKNAFTLLNIFLQIFKLQKINVCQRLFSLFQSVQLQRNKTGSRVSTDNDVTNRPSTPSKGLWNVSQHREEYDHDQQNDRHRCGHQHEWPKARDDDQSQVYLGAILCKDGTCSAEIRNRVASAMAVMARLIKPW